MDDESCRADVGDTIEHDIDFRRVQNWVRCAGVLAKKSEMKINGMPSRAGIEHLDQKIVEWTDQALYALEPDLITQDVQEVKFTSSNIQGQKTSWAKYLDAKSWQPLINEIEVKYHNAPMLHHGLRLVDLPGFGDIDPFRRHITERYERKSAAFVFVGTWHRIEDDNVFWRKVKVCMAVVDDPSKIFIVLTHKDHYKTSDIDKYLDGAKDPIGAIVQ